MHPKSTGQLFSRSSRASASFLAKHSQKKEKKRRYSVRTRTAPVENEDIFDICEARITKVNMLKDPEMREVEKVKIKKKAS